MNTQKKAMVSPNNSWFESYFSADEAERRRLLFPMSVTLAFGTGLCDKDGWFEGCLKRRDELFALLETKLDGTAIGAERMGAVFTEWDQDTREQFFDGLGLSAELHALCALFVEAEECKKIVNEIIASKSKTKPQETSQPNPDWRVSRASWNQSQRGA
jgi:hypothetical protein